MATCLPLYVQINDKLVGDTVDLFAKLLDDREAQMLARWREFIDANPEYVSSNSETLRQTIEESYASHDSIVEVLQGSFTDLVDTLTDKSLATLSSKARFEAAAARRFAVNGAIFLGTLGLVEIAKGGLELIEDGEIVVRGAFDPAARDGALVVPIAETMAKAELAIRQRVALAYRVMQVLHSLKDGLETMLSSGESELNRFRTLPNAQDMHRRLTVEFERLEAEGSLKRYDKRVEPITFKD
jgi:hypothetical protein